ncbi:MAG: [acyl-carrier-protein] S-malonyltransferase [Dehalococcoidales bacterium]|jgi:[acyl-carrier-protein] S-malonyltransferase|nr:[acyl-carrier-protein] S-malonyltransferase [Dehalococcoidales bacterium]MDP6043864.1 ACP S-malonyltransferase [Dehalococcoidales bacterium]MDP6448810.1 ACP S-malonyltransferase [Dehalococcoidales bacterium]MDP6577327.1 ACP S-malonyltransferase [Dehalococcoidales bacterium]
MSALTKTAYVFPGQGSQWAGMGRDLYTEFASARTIFDRADEVLGFPLSRLCFEGPEDELRQTINAQPAILTVSYTCLQSAREVNPGLPPPVLVAGHSLGEYTALAVAGVFDFDTAVYLARERGRLMHEAGKIYPGSMVAIIGADEDLLDEVCRQTDTCLANVNCPGQLVISGDREKVTQAMNLARNKGVPRVIPLPVSGAFHTPLMQPAYDGMTRILASLPFQEPVIPAIANTTARPLTTTESVKAELLSQLCNCVQWQRSIEYMITQGVSTFIEIGPGKVLTGLIRRINKKVRTLNIGDAEAVRSIHSEAQ